MTTTYVYIYVYLQESRAALFPRRLSVALFAQKCFRRLPLNTF